MIGIAFALNLAYIGLPRFRYREQIQNHTKKRLDDLPGVTAKIKTTSWYGALSRMAKMNNGESVTKKSDLPKERWAIIYLGLFESHRDRRLVVWLCLGLVILLSLGVAHSAKHYGTLPNGYNFLWIFSGGMFHIWFSVIFLVGLWPCFLVWQGSGVVKEACNYANRQIEDMEKTMQAGVEALDKPD